MLKHHYPHGICIDYFTLVVTRILPLTQRTHEVILEYATFVSESINISHQYINIRPA